MLKFQLVRRNIASCIHITRAVTPKNVMYAIIIGKSCGCIETNIITLKRISTRRKISNIIKSG